MSKKSHTAHSLKEIKKLMPSVPANGVESLEKETSANGRSMVPLREKTAGNRPEKAGAQVEKIRKLRVRLMDSNEMGTLIAGKGKIGQPAVEQDEGLSTIELDDGLVVRLHANEFIVVDAEEDRQLMSGKVSRTLAGEGLSRQRWERSANANPSGISHGGDLVYDLHIEALPGGRSVPEGQQLDFQLAHFHAIMRANLCHRGMRFSLVHGVGDGILKSRIRKELDEVYALSCSYVPGHSGVTVITIK